MRKLGRLPEKRKKYYVMIFTYKKRRDALRDKYGITKICNARFPMPIGYVKTAKKINYKITRWNRQIKRIDALAVKISTLERSIKEFTGVKIAHHLGVRVKGEVWLAKAFYYKYGLENGISQIELRAYIGLDTNQQREEPPIFRSRLTKSFVTIPENKEKWMQFKRFFENEYKLAILDDRRAYSSHVPKKKDNATYACLLQPSSICA